MPSTAPSNVLVLPDVSRLGHLSDDELMGVQRELGAAMRRVGADSAAVAGELARRSSRELGYGGLAQRKGARTVERLVSNLTGMSGADARAMVAVGEAMTGETPWLSPIATIVNDGVLSVGAAAAIRHGLGDPNVDVSVDDLGEAARQLAQEANGWTPEKAAQRARQARDELDAEGVAAREAALRERRYLRLTPQADGMTRVHGLLDPESAALITDAFDRVTAPRRGGVRFVDPVEKVRAEAIQNDERTTEQLTVDAFVHVVRIAGEIDDGAIFGRTAPAVRVHVSLDSLQRGVGGAFAEGAGAGPVDRHSASDGVRRRRDPDPLR